MAIVSENFAREYWGSPANALGKHIRESPTEDWHEIVGVAGNIYDEGVDKPAPAAVYWPLFQTQWILCACCAPNNLGSPHSLSVLL
ncbi:MAG TPA: hypothetical protein VGS10_22750 [Terracidiphilus sp.]|nr:hypothetical protein [Terracidiphilus sp.]